MKRLTIGFTMACGCCAITSASPPRPDFDGDGFDDLAIGAPNDDVGGIQNAGAVQIIHGTPAGAAAARNQRWTQDSDDVPDVAETSDRFGTALAWGDFNGDGFSDLAIGCNAESVGDRIQAGSVTVLYGSAIGLTADEAQLWTQSTQGIAGTAQVGNQFGWMLATGDFNGDGRDDLAISVLGHDLASSQIAAPDGGAVNVMYGSDSGLRAFGDEQWTQNSFGVPDLAEASDRFGYALASGDFNDDGFDDLAVGVPGEDVLVNLMGVAIDAGIVNVIYGSHTGLTGSGAQAWSQNSPGIADACDSNESFGFTLTIGDFNGDDRDDLVVAAPFEDFGAAFNAGIVHVILGNNVELSSTHSLWFNAGSLGLFVLGQTRLGFALAAADFDADGHDDLAVALPRQPVNLVASAGAVVVLHGSSEDDNMALTLEDMQVWTQDSPGIVDRMETGDRFGESLWAGDFNGDNRADLAIGVPHEDVGIMHFNAGAVAVIYSHEQKGLRQQGNQLWTRRSPGIRGPVGSHAYFGWARALID
jgi:hypothetical protein